MCRDPNKAARACQVTAVGKAGRCLVLGAMIAATPLQAAFADYGIAVLGIELVSGDLNSGGEKLTAEEQARLQRTAAQIRAKLSEAGYRVIAAERTEAALVSDPHGQYLHACNGCELDYGRALGAHWVLVGWVQHVSNLILNLNVLVKDVESGALIASGFVDLRGNTDKAWARATDYLMVNTLLDRLDAKR
jgi:hypothetical protein